MKCSRFLLGEGVFLLLRKKAEGGEGLEGFFNVSHPAHWAALSFRLGNFSHTFIHE